MQFIKADTSTKVAIGPVVAVGDGFTPVTTLALGTADEAEILKHNAAAVTDISGYTFAAIASADGYYNLTIPAGGSDTEGRLTVLINDDSLCLPVRADFMVVNANVYDSLYAAAATDYLQIDQIQLGGNTQSATDLKDFADAGYDPSTNKVQGVVLTDTTITNADMRGTDNALLASSTIQKNSAFSNLEFLMVEADDGRTPLPGLTVAGQRSIDGGAFASVSGAIAEVGNGIYQVDLLAADTNGDVITYRFTSATADDTFLTITTT